MTEAKVLGTTPRRLRAADIRSAIWGVRSASRPVTVHDRCSQFALRLRSDAVFSHTTAALLLGAPLPLRWEQDAAIHVSVPSPEPAPHAKGLQGHSLEFVPGDVVEVAGLRCTSPTRTWLELGTILDLPDLVAVGDFLIRRRAPFVTRSELVDAASGWSGRRGARRLREAAELIDERAESRPETHLRLLLWGSGLKDVQINHTLVDTESGKRARPDFTFAREKVIVEYQGDYHRTVKQWRADMTRRSRLELSGWVVLEVNADDLRAPQDLIQRIQLARTLRAPH